MSAVRLWLRRGAMQYKSRNDVELLDMARRGNTRAFDELVARHRGRVHGMARTLLSSDSDVIDAVTETFVFAYRDLMARGTETHPGACIHRHAVRAVLTRAGRQRIAELQRS